MYYNANTARASVTLPMLSLYAAHVAQGHTAALRAVRRAMIRAAVKADLSVMQDIHRAITAAIAHDCDRATVNAAGRAALTSAVRVAPATFTPDGEQYAAGMIRAALMVARKTLSRACERGGTDTQRAALRDLDRVYAAAVRYDVAGMSWEASAEALQAMIACVDMRDTSTDMTAKQRDNSGISHDAVDMYDEAMSGIVGGYTFDKGNYKGMSLCGTSTIGSNPREHVRAAYLTANRAMHKQRAATIRETSTEYVREQGGDLVALTTAIGRIINADERWTLSDVPGESRVNVAALREHLPRALALCTKTQRDIAALLAAGYSVNAIANKTKRDRRTVQRNIAIMRGTCTEYLHTNAPDVLPMFNMDKYSAQAMQKEAAAHMPRTDAGKAAKKAADKATQAERARRYRERKKAERAAAANA